jgi:hypothetical protein
MTTTGKTNTSLLAAGTRGASPMMDRARGLPILVAALFHSVACGSSQSAPQASGGGSAGASGNVGASGSGANGGGAERSGSGWANDGSGGNATAGAGGATAGDAGSAAKGGTSAGGATGGSGGTSAGGATGGSGGGAQAAACPASLPIGASPCDSNGQVCFYEDCVGAGRTACNLHGTRRSRNQLDTPNRGMRRGRMCRCARYREL